MISSLYEGDSFLIFHYFGIIIEHIYIYIYIAREALRVKKKYK